jgi:hypothetical protein
MRAPKSAFGAASLLVAGFVVIIVSVSHCRNQPVKTSLMPLGPEYMPESFPFAFPEPFDPKKRSLSMVEVLFDVVPV